MSKHKFPSNGFIVFWVVFVLTALLLWFITPQVRS
jgi:hypothetical protein